MAYLAYTEYLNYGGAEIDLIAFDNLEYDARKEIDNLTFGRVKNLSTIPESVKRCETKIIEIIRNNEQYRKGAGAVTSFNNDGYSETRQAVDAQSIGQLIYGTCEMYLADELGADGQYLMYGGGFPHADA